MRDALSFLIDPLQAVLTWFHGTLGVSWAISIILLTIIVRMVLIPLTVKQFTSMRAMQKIQPKMKEVQQKYKDDKQKLNEELMKLYKEHKVNPFGSCLPMLLQMPVMMALYFMLTSPEVKDLFASGPQFLWISDITQTSTVLVLIYMASQLLSSRIMMTATDQTQKMMMYIMPLGFGVIFLFTQFPAGVLIYWVTANIWTVGQQLVVKEIIHAKEGREEAAEAAEKKTEAAEKKSEAAEKSGGKGAGSPKSKKKKRRR